MSLKGRHQGTAGFVCRRKQRSSEEMSYQVNTRRLSVCTQGHLLPVPVSDSRRKAVAAVRQRHAFYLNLFSFLLFRDHLRSGTATTPPPTFHRKTHVRVAPFQPLRPIIASSAAVSATGRSIHAPSVPPVMLRLPTPSMQTHAPMKEVLTFKSSRIRKSRQLVLKIDTYIHKTQTYSRV